MIQKVQIMANTNQDVYGTDAPPSVDLGSPQEGGQPSQPISGLSSAGSQTAGVANDLVRGVGNILNAGITAVKHPFTPVPFNMLADGTGVPSIDNVLGKIIPLNAKPSTQDINSNPITKALQDMQSAMDYNSKVYPGEDLGSLIQKASEATKTTFQPNKEIDAGLRAGLAPIAANLMNQQWAKAVDYLFNDVVKNAVEYAPYILAATNPEIGAPAAMAYLGLKSAGSAQKEAAMRNKSQGQQEAYALAQGIMNPLLFSYLPGGTKIFGLKLASVFGKKMTSNILNESMRGALSKSIGALSDNPFIQQQIVMRASQFSNMVMQHVFDIERRTIKQALFEMAKQGVLDAVTMGVINGAGEVGKNILGTYQRGGKISSNEAFSIDEIIQGHKNGFEDPTGKKITTPHVVEPSVIHLETIIKKIISTGSFTDNPALLNNFQALSNAIKSVHNERGSISIGKNKSYEQVIKEKGGSFLGVTKGFKKSDGSTTADLIQFRAPSGTTLALKSTDFSASEVAKKIARAEEGQYVINRPFEPLWGKNDKKTAGSLRQEFSGQMNEQKARGGQLVGDIKKILPKEVDRQAAFWIKAANGAEGPIRTALQNDKFDPYEKGLKRALELIGTPKATEALKRVGSYYEQAGNVSKEVGSIGAIRENYQNRIYSPEPPADYVKTELRKTLKQNTRHSKQRVFDTEFQAVEAGKKFATTDIAASLSIHNEEMARVNASIKMASFMDKMQLAKFADEKEAPRDWKEVEGVRRNGQKLYAPKGIADGLRAITEPDMVKKIDALRNIGKYQNFIKTFDVSLSFFHHITLVKQALDNGNVSAIINLPRMNTWLESPEFKQLERHFAQHGGITSTVDINRDIMGSLFRADKDGDLIDKALELPGIKQSAAFAKAGSNFLFGKVQRYIKVMDYGNKMSNWIGRHPDATPAEIKEAMIGITKQVNSAYGGLNWEALGVRKTELSLARLVLLAPDWVMSNLQMPWMALSDFKTAGNAARANLIVGFLTARLITEGLNHILTGHSSSENDKGHKNEVQLAPHVYFSAYRGATGEVQKMASNIMEQGAKGAARYAASKLAPGGRTLIGALTNVKYSGHEIVGRQGKDETNSHYALRATIEYAKFMRDNLLPMPFSIASLIDYLKREPEKSAGGTAAVATGVGRYSAPYASQSKSAGPDLSSEIDKELKKAGF